MNFEDTIYDVVRRAVADQLHELNFRAIDHNADPSTTWGSMADCATWCSATLPQLRMWRFNNADFPASKIGKSIRINKAEFLAWLEKKRPASTVEAVDGQLNDLKAKKARTGVQNA
jgi:hypothetical protein